MVRARRRFGQHFLESAWADRLVAAIEPQDGDRFLEIGPGPGALTLRLAPRVAHLTAVEVDRDLAAALAPQLPPNVELVVADFLALDLTSLLQGGAVRVAGNLPYNISSPILFRLIEASRTCDPSTRSGSPRAPSRGEPANPRPCDKLRVAPSIVEGRTREPATLRQAQGCPEHRRGAIVDATLMLQREVAERLEARPGTGDYGVLSISVQLHADVRRVLTLPPGAFRPAPKVHSAVVRLTFRPPSSPPRDERVLEAMVRSMFTQRRKTLANALSRFAEGRGVSAVTALEASDIDPSRRPETLDLAELTRLADHFTTGSDR
jgi:16S rRNA (adenine1518-N6/adenine1519-N6)-dimethyltransferase